MKKKFAAIIAIGLAQNDMECMWLFKIAFGVFCRLAPDYSSFTF